MCSVVADEGDLCREYLARESSYAPKRRGDTDGGDRLEERVSTLGAGERGNLVRDDDVSEWRGSLTGCVSAEP